MKDYQPIDCNYYDYIEHFAILRKEVLIKYQEPDTLLTKALTARIKDTRVKNGEEFMVLSNNQEIRLDYLISLDDIVFPVEKGTCKINS